MTLKTGFLLFIGLVMVILASTYVAKCTRDKPIIKHQENKVAITKSDKHQSEIDSLERATWNSQKKALLETIEDLKKKNSALAKKDVQLESRYRKAPSIAGCDSVITSKNSRIGALEDMTARQEQVSRANDSLLTSYARSIRGKDQTIHQLNAGYEQAIIDLQKAKRPKRWGIGGFIGGGVGRSLRPEPIIGAGITYNFIRL